MDQAPPPGGLALLDAQEIKQLLRRFDKAWQSGVPPHPEEFLPTAFLTSPDGGAAGQRLLHGLIQIDLEYRWRLAIPGTVNSLPQYPRLEDYVRVYPALGPLEELPIELI